MHKIIIIIFISLVFLLTFLYKEEVSFLKNNEEIIKTVKKKIQSKRNPASNEIKSISKKSQIEPITAEENVSKKEIRSYTYIQYKTYSDSVKVDQLISDLDDIKYEEFMDEFIYIQNKLYTENIDNFNSDQSEPVQKDFFLEKKLKINDSNIYELAKKDAVKLVIDNSDYYKNDPICSRNTFIDFFNNRFRDVFLTAEQDLYNKIEDECLFVMESDDHFNDFLMEQDDDYSDICVEKNNDKVNFGVDDLNL